MTPPRRLDADGMPRKTREYLRMIGWQLFTEAGIVRWCGHDHHYLVVPDADGERAVLVPIWGEAV